MSPGVEIPKSFLKWYDNLSREDQLEVHATIAKRAKPSPSYLKCKPEADKVLAVMQILKSYGLDHIQPYREGPWVKWKFDSQAERNKVWGIGIFNEWEVNK